MSLSILQPILAMLSFQWVVFYLNLSFMLVSIEYYFPLIYISPVQAVLLTIITKWKWTKPIKWSHLQEQGYKHIAVLEGGILLKEM